MCRWPISKLNPKPLLGENAKSNFHGYRIIIELRKKKNSIWENPHFQKEPTPNHITQSSTHHTFFFGSWLIFMKFILEISRKMNSYTQSTSIFFLCEKFKSPSSSLKIVYIFYINFISIYICSWCQTYNVIQISFRSGFQLLLLSFSVIYWLGIWNFFVLLCEIYIKKICLIW